MPNDLLIHAINSAGLTRDQVADLATVDPKTVERWIAGRIPHPRHRALLARELGVPADQLWPDATVVRGRRGLEELAGAWSRRDDPNAPAWRALLQAATHQVELVGYSLLSVLETRGAIGAIEAKARDGIPVRIALADPGTPHVLAADLAGRQPGRLVGRIHAAEQRLLALAGVAGISIRRHQVATTHTILRFDDELLLTIHLHGTPGLHAPALHVRRRQDYGIFDQITRHIEDVWNSAHAVASAADHDAAATEAPAPAERSGADALLDRFDNIWRPGY